MINFSIIGCGLIGRKRFDAIKNNVLYVCDKEISRAEELSKKSSSAIPTSDIELAVTSSNIQAVIVATYNSMLAPIALMAINAKKHVLIEKPGATNSNELKKILEAAISKGISVRIGYNHRFHPAVQKAYELKSELGQLMFVRGRYGHGGRIGYEKEWRFNPELSGGGELIDQGVHLIDLAQWFIGPFSKIYGRTKNYYWNNKVEDNVFLTLETQDEKVAFLHASCTEWKNLFSFEIYGKNGKLHIEGLGGSYGIERLSYYKMLPEMGPPETTIYEFPRSDNSWKLEIEAFISDIKSNNLNSVIESIKTLELVDKIYSEN